MPTYQYQCQKCGHLFELFQSMSSSPLTTCPKDSCPEKKWGKGRVKRVIAGGAGLIFKGSGFYITDYRSEGYKEAARKESSPPAAAPAAESKAPKTGSEAKPAKPAKSPKTE